MKQAFRLSCALVLFVLMCGAHALAQTPTPTPTPGPDPFVTQLTNSRLDSSANDMSGNGRFVVVESTGDIATEKTTTRNNADGNREIFLIDYAQRRIFQITDTKNALKPAPSPTPTPTPSASPTPTPSPTPDLTRVDVQVNNTTPMISNDGRWIVFSSNAITPGNFDGNTAVATLKADGNQEIWLYHVPAVGSVDLTQGVDAPFVALDGGTFIQVTNTSASRLPTPGDTGVSPFVADDNREATINDDGSVIAFVSTRNLVGTGNTDANPDIFLYSNTGVPAMFQVTATPPGSTGNPIFTSNPAISGDGSVIAFISNGNISAGNSTNNSDLNAEIYLASYNGTAATVTRQVTRTTQATIGFSVNLLSPGRRLSRDGNLLAFESSADLSGNGAVQSFSTVFVYNIAASSFTQVGPRAAAGGDLLRFPVFTDYTGLTPATVMFVSALNFLPDGTFPTIANDATGLNPLRRAQVFFTSLPFGTGSTFKRLTNTLAPVNALFGNPAIQLYSSNTRKRSVFTLPNTEMGGGNTDGSAEAYYLLSPNTTDATGTPAVAFATGASNIPVANPTPSPSPTPPFTVLGLAAGELGIMTSTTPLAPSAQSSGTGSETLRRPSLPIELNGVSVAINGAAAGLYFVSPGQINFVVPPGLPASGTGTYPVVINNNGTAIRTTLAVLLAQPDIFTSTNDAGGRARIFLQGTMTGEPFTVTTADNTIVSIFATGVRNVTKSQMSVIIGSGTTATTITGDRILCANEPQGTTALPCFQTDAPGFDQINVKLPPSLAGSGDVPVVISVTIGSTTFTSRPVATAPHTTIN